MAPRRKQDAEWIGLFAQLAGVVVLLSLISPQVQQMISAIGFIAICFLGLVVVGMIGFGIYRFATRSERPQVFECNVDSAILPPSALRQENRENRPQTSLDLIEQLRTIDWFQFEKVVGLAYRK